jgi:hypothetical protein
VSGLRTVTARISTVHRPCQRGSRDPAETSAAVARRFVCAVPAHVAEQGGQQPRREVIAQLQPVARVAGRGRTQHVRPVVAPVIER